MEALTMQGGAKIRDMCEALKDVLDDFNMVFTELGIHINSLDVNNVALVNATLWGHRFERYSCGQTFVCGLNMAVLYKTFKPVNKATQLTLRIDEKYPKALAVCMENAATGFKFDVTLKIWGSDKKMLKIENSIFNRYVTLPSGDFQSLIGYISNFQNSADDDNKIVDIELANGELVLCSRGQFGIARVAVKERTTGLNVSKGEIDPLDDKLVKKEVDAEEAALAAEKASQAAAAAAAGASGHAKKKSKKTAAPAYEDDADGESSGENVEEDDAGIASKTGGKRIRTDGQDQFSGSTIGALAAPAVVAPAIAQQQQQQQEKQQQSTTTLIDQASEMVMAADGSPPVKNSYNLRYLRYFTKATPLSTSVRIFLRPDYPIIVMYNIGTMGVMRYCLGPASADDAEMEEQVDDDDQDDGPTAEDD
jgi:proliferating cell nuclear antigen PCNA